MVLIKGYSFLTIQQQSILQRLLQNKSNRKLSSDEDKITNLYFTIETNRKLIKNGDYCLTTGVGEDLRHQTKYLKSRLHKALVRQTTAELKKAADIIKKLEQEKNLAPPHEEQHPHLKFNPNNIERELYRASSVSIPTYSHKVGTVSNAIDNGIGLSRNGFGHGPKLSWGSWE